MSSDGDARRARLGDAAVNAARAEARQAPPPGPALFEFFAIRFGWQQPAPGDDAHSTDVA